jgi:hypothetical protein
VQTKALIILNFLDEVDKNDGNIQNLRRAALSSGMFEPSKLFPESFGEEPAEVKDISDVDDTDDEGAQYDYSGVTWKGGSDAYGEYEQLMAQIGAMHRGRMTGDALSSRPEWTDWT